ncbi:MAG: DNA polymerase III subunit beta [Armatimonadota bacterium]|nr:MAG: DNA polymerase III subunit beta [Armatimonadota bacterium]
MKLTSRRGLLSDALQLVSRAVTGRSTLPILSNVLLEVSGDRLRLLTSDLEMWVDCAIPAEDTEDGALTLPAKILNEVVASLPEAEVKIATDDGNAIALTCGSSKYSIQGLAAEEFPSLPEAGGGINLTLPHSELRRVLRTTEFAASADETRAILAGILMTWDGQKLSLVATNMHRLALDNVVVQDGPAEQASAVVPARALREVLRSLSADPEPTVRVHLGESQAVFDLDRVVVTSRIIEGQFPNYERVIPTEAEHTIRADRQELLAAVRRADIVARADANKVVLRLQPSGLLIEAESAEIGRAHEEVPIELEGEQAEIAFNAEYLIEALEVITEERVQMDLTGPLSPGVLKPVGESAYLYIIMPMQLT